MKLMKSIPYFFLCCFAYAGSVFAANPPPAAAKLAGHRTFSHANLNMATGFAGIYAKDANLKVGSENDTLHETNSGSVNSLPAQLGFGYIFWLGHAQQYTKSLQWFTSIEPQLNAYYLSNFWGLKGNVYRFGNPADNDLSYRMLVQNIRAMADVALTFAQWRWFSIYGIAGIGIGWNGIGYRDYDRHKLECTLAHLSLKTRWTTNFVWEVGGGLNVAIYDRVGVFGEFLYTFLGHGQVSSRGNTDGITSVSSSTFSLTTAQALFGLKITL